MYRAKVNQKKKTKLKKAYRPNYKADLNDGIAKHRFEEVEPMEFYRDIFGDGELDEAGAFTKGKYTGIALEILPEINKDAEEFNRRKVKRHTITDDLDKIDELLYSNNFCITSPISYAGWSRKSTNARFMYALCIEVDSLRWTDDNPFMGLDELIHQCGKIQLLPTPTYIVTSGNGIHLYYVFTKPIPLFPNVVKSIEKWKRTITRKMWNRYITTLYEPDQVQYESPFQGFRMVGSLTKRGLQEYKETGYRNPQEVVRAYKFGKGKRVSIDYLNTFVQREDLKLVEIYKTDLPLKKAMELYPDWYERRIVNKEPRKNWECKRDLYDWWKNRILNETQVGHRYYCLMCLCIYAIKCGNNITQEELEADCFEIMEHFDSLSIDENNRFTEKDVMDALQIYEDRGYVTYPRNSIANRSGLHIEPNKRNRRKQKDHLQGDWIGENGRPTTNICKSNREMTLRDMREKGEITGRPKGSGTKHQAIQEWRQQNPDGRKADCIRELGLTKPTVYKWWDVPLEKETTEPEYEQILDLRKQFAEMENDLW